MKKYILLIFSCLLLFGCSEKEKKLTCSLSYDDNGESFHWKYEFLYNNDKITELKEIKISSFNSLEDADEYYAVSKKYCELQKDIGDCSLTIDNKEVTILLKFNLDTYKDAKEFTDYSYEEEKKQMELTGFVCE